MGRFRAGHGAEAYTVREGQRGPKSAKKYCYRRYHKIYLLAVDADLGAPFVRARSGGPSQVAAGLR